MALTFNKEKHLEHDIKNYKIGKIIGEGTFGKVKTAIHICTGEKVSLLIILGSNKSIREEAAH